MEVLHARIQHGVGQGSFHSASVEASIDNERIRFDYVYDCGALSGSGVSKALKQTVARLGLEHRPGSSGRGVLDVVALSHYDADHLNGAKHLSTLFDVRRVFLPYLSPDELLFVIASQPEMLSAEQVRELHQLAYGGGTLWGLPVTMVRGGEGEGGEGEGEGGGLPPRLDTARRSDRPSDAIGNVPRPVRLTLKSTSSGSSMDTVPSDMSHHDDVLATSANGQQLWRLRFWNRGLDPVLVAEIRNQLKNCGFPLEKLGDSAGADLVISWLAVSKNRKAAVKAYANAICTFNPSWAHEAKSGGLANLLSLAMYAGPDFEVVEVHCMRRHHTVPHYWHNWWGHSGGAGNGGWLGTGDAPLGETAIWADFQHHYADEIPAVSTYLVPHHGAAPSGGPRYYHPGLNHSPGVASVISYGATNSYGHPRYSVVTQILAQHGVLFDVTEACENGFHEVFRFNASC